jgi:hypothetical protein
MGLFTGLFTGVDSFLVPGRELLYQSYIGFTRELMGIFKILFYGQEAGV